MDIFVKEKNYLLEEIISICDENNLITVDCLKSENMISVEKYNNGELGDCIFELKRSKAGLFKLSWVDKIEVARRFTKFAGKTC